MDLKKPVSGRQFAKMVGQAESAVRKAVTRGSIIEGRTPDGKLIPEVAAREWGKDILPEYVGSEKTVKPAKKDVEKPDPKKPTTRKRKTPELTTAEEVVKSVLSEHSEEVDEEDLEDEDVEKELSDKIKKPEAERVTSILKAKILQIALREKQGELISRKKVTPILFAYGQEIRVALEGLSNRTIDKILACNTRNEAKRVMDEEIHNTLNMLADIPNRKI